MLRSRSRARVALGAAGLLLIGLFLEPFFWVLKLVALLVALWATYELHDMGRQKGIRSSLNVSLAASTAFVACGLLDHVPFVRAVPVVIVALLVASFAAQVYRRGTEDAFLGVPLNMFGPLYVALPVALGFQILQLGQWWLLFVLTGVWACDIAAYYTGRLMGTHSLAPGVSPKKTWEGAVGGALACVVACLAFKYWVPPEAFRLEWIHVFVLACIIAVSAEAGDLAESCLKRDAGVKDSGSIMLGHGGILDRIDSLLFALGAVYSYLLLMGYMVPGPR
jgi:phosphatidate cytidylyltransferase